MPCRPTFRPSSPSRRWLGLVLVAPSLLTLVCGFPARAGVARSELDARIRQHRTGLIAVETAPGAEVRVEQLRHEFWFGAALANHVFGGRLDPANTAAYQQAFLTNFNAAVTENALKWHVMEPRQDRPDYSVVDAILRWTEAHEIPLRGHNIFWGIPNRVPDWQKAMDPDTLRDTVRARALDIGRRYRGRFAEYDLNNEMIHGNFYADRLGPGITRDMAAWVHAADPDAVLYLNDYDILTGNRLDDYCADIRRLLADGTGIGGIGVQGHLHADSFDPEALQKALDQLAEFNLPIRVTEFNMPGQRSAVYREKRATLTDAEEAAKARALADYYRICFAHPAVQGILMWGFWEGANWIPASSLYRRDWTPTPAAHAYRDLVHGEWWTRVTVHADAAGRARIPAFHGRHRVSVGDAERIVELKSGQGPVKVAFPPATGQP
ncbi:MAG: endo-1,4-beta-xylanase [Verrucomicrobiales bacterium]|nr:endo-1,4-beta-xylanase [Verrucomicrobiales bacterium]MCP5525711.1 endo-1,4-beta-xylanase [Verrucomicrobiales bacterium]